MRTPSQRLEEKLLKENLWLFLMALLKEKARKRSELRALVQKRFAFLPGEVTSYKVLFLLEAGGYVKKDGKSYYPTENGLTQLIEGKKLLKRTEKLLRR
ncbi:MAG: PadR family transcriptional regulator [Candidatus Aenigmarchaeota archaeon]|nr:PadR family transcriptional regulator [Candidatus Aenigmarchaeota archaeon]